MRWIVKIENKLDQRIKVVFDPQKELIYFIGQFKPHNLEWVDFSVESITMNVDLDTIKEILYSVFDKMKIRLEAYNNLKEGFNLIKVIEIKEDE